MITCNLEPPDNHLASQSSSLQLAPLLSELVLRVSMSAALALPSLKRLLRQVPRVLRGIRLSMASMMAAVRELQLVPSRQLQSMVLHLQMRTGMPCSRIRRVSILRWMKVCFWRRRTMMPVLPHTMQFCSSPCEE